jgi:hypothetical protein
VASDFVGTRWWNQYDPIAAGVESVLGGPRSYSPAVGSSPTVVSGSDLWVPIAVGLGLLYA